MAPDARGPEAAWAALSAAGSERARLRVFLDEWGHDERLLVELLRRPVPQALLEELGTRRPWCERPRLAAAVTRQARTPAHIGLRLLGLLGWRELADVAAGPYLPGIVRQRAETLLRDQLPDLRLGDRVALARLATPGVLRALLLGGEERVVQAGLDNPRLGESALVALLGLPQPPKALIEACAAATRWSASYAVRRALALQPRTPLPVALAQVTALVTADLLRVAETPELAPLLRLAAERAAEARREPEAGS